VVVVGTVVGVVVVTVLTVVVVVGVDFADVVVVVPEVEDGVVVVVVGVDFADVVVVVPEVVDGEVEVLPGVVVGIVTTTGLVDPARYPTRSPEVTAEPAKTAWVNRRTRANRRSRCWGVRVVGVNGRLRHQSRRRK